MQEHSFLPEFSDDDVVEFDGGNLYKVGSLRNGFKEFIDSKQLASLFYDFFKNRNIIICYPKDWLSQGVYSQILKSNAQGWTKGKLKLRLSLEFEPDEPEIKEPPSPLDEFRKTPNK